MKRQCYLKLLYYYGKEEKWIFFFFVIALICMFMPQLTFLHLIPCKDAYYGNGLISNLGLSYIAGFIIYLLTVFFPNMRKGEIFFSEVTEKLRYMIDDYSDFINNFCNEAQNPTKENFKNTWIVKDEYTRNINKKVVSIKLKEDKTRYCIERFCFFACKEVICKEMSALYTKEEWQYGLALEVNYAMYFFNYNLKNAPYCITEKYLEKVVNAIFDYRDNLQALRDSLKKRSLFIN